MREIKFRGKSVDSGQWLHGNLCQLGDSCWIARHPEGRNDARLVVTTYLVIDDWLEVIPETVGQYTGLKDKRGKEIYEGDIVRTIWGYAQILFFEDGAYVFKGPKNHNFLNEREITDRQIEIIGNVFEHPELLKTG